jgi:hypothetical protein
MKISIDKPSVQRPCHTPYGVLEKNFTASAKLDKDDDFHLEYEIEVITSGSGINPETGIFIKRLTVVMNNETSLGVTTSHLRAIPLRALLEATVHKAVYSGSRKSQLNKFAAVSSATKKDIKAAELILDNPGKSQAQLLMKSFNLTEGSARNLITRLKKLGLLPTANSGVEDLPSFKEVSAHGDYIHQVLEGKIKDPLPPSEWFALQEEKKKRKATNARKKK